MSTKKTVPLEKQLTVIARVEPGSLGPDGMDKIEDFCRYANHNMVSDGQRYTRWQIIPRYDKTLPEMEYYIQHKKLNNTTRQPINQQINRTTNNKQKKTHARKNKNTHTNKNTRKKYANKHANKKTQTHTHTQR